MNNNLNTLYLQKTKEMQYKTPPRGIKRNTGLFGTVIPPKKERSCNGFITMRFLILGVIPSKKNNYTISTNLYLLANKAKSMKSGAECYEYIKKGLQPKIIASNNYLKWEEEAIVIATNQLQYWLTQYEKYDLMPPFKDCSLKVYHYWKDNLRRDNANKLQSIQDMLVKAKILYDDDYMYLNKTVSEAENYKGELTKSITLVDLTLRV